METRTQSPSLDFWKRDELRYNSCLPRTSPPLSDLIIRKVYIRPLCDRGRIRFPPLPGMVNSLGDCSVPIAMSIFQKVCRHSLHHVESRSSKQSPFRSYGTCSWIFCRLRERFEILPLIFRVHNALFSLLLLMIKKSFSSVSGCVDGDWTAVSAKEFQRLYAFCFWDCAISNAGFLHFPVFQAYIRSLHSCKTDQVLSHDFYLALLQLIVRMVLYSSVDSWISNNFGDKHRILRYWHRIVWYRLLAENWVYHF